MNQRPTVALVGGTILTGADLNPVSETLLIRDGVIAAIGASDQQIYGVEEIDIQGLTVAPGLIDCHVHLVLDGEPEGRIPKSEPLYETAIRAAEAAQATLLSGVTTVRDLGGRDYVELALRDSIDRGRLPGPRILCGCKLIAITSSAGNDLPGMFREADGLDEVRKAVREQLKAGADVIKVMASGAVMAVGQKPGKAHFTVDELRVAVSEAHGEGRRVAAHAHGARAARNAVDAGIDSIEHGTFIFEDEALIASMARSGTYLVPTLSFHRRIAEHDTTEGVPEHMVQAARAATDSHAKSFVRARELGVPIAFGTDSGSPFCPHGENSRELELMVESGMSPRDAVRAATATAAECLGLGETLGSIDTGKTADLIMLEGDPLADVAVIRTGLRGVLKSGRVIVPPGGRITP